MSDLTFRRAREADIPELRVLAERIWHTSYRELLSEAQIEYMLGWMYGAETIWRELANGVVWEILELDGAALGYLAYGPPAEEELKLHKLYLLPEQQGRGFAQRAIERVLEIAAAARARVVLNVNKANLRAQRAYERAGFRVVDAVTNDIGGGFVMDDFIYVRDFTASPSGQRASCEASA
jgi:RimJ/RimL family protein N-acetyltransferase